MRERIIFHIDVNNAFLSWTAVDMLNKGHKTDIRNRYSVIAGDQNQRRGIILAKSNLCKQKGVVTAEPIYFARKKCPYLEIYKPDFRLYKKCSDLLFNYLSSYSDIIERYSIDECFVDYTHSQDLFGDPLEIAFKIKEDIKKNLGFTVNIGIGNNKLCAKMASDFSKPDKIHTLFNNEIEEKMWPLPVSELFMIGKSTFNRLKELNIRTIYDLAHSNEVFLTKHFKSFGKLMWEYANGIDNSRVEYESYNPKSISSSTVLPYNYSDKNDIYKVIKELAIDTGLRLRDKKMYASNINIWLKYADFTKYSKQIKLDNNINGDLDIYNIGIELFNNLWNGEPIRALSVGVSNLSESNSIQLNIFDQTKKEESLLQETIDKINNKYHHNLITYADILKEKK